MNKRGLQKKRDAEKLWSPRKKEIEWLYYEQNWSHAKIGGYYGISQTAISKVMKRLGIKSRGRGRTGKLNGNYKNGTQSRLYRQLIEKDFCENCKATERLVVHHKNGDHMDNRLKNLMILCESCHNSYHKKLWWDKQDKSKIKRDESGKFQQK